MIVRNKDQEDIQQWGKTYLLLNPDPVPRFLLLRDVLHRDAGDQELVDAKANMLHSKWIKQLAEEQALNGGWSRFHSMDSKVKHKIPTTEYAVFRALALGLTKDDTILSKAQGYLEGLLSGTVPWPEDEGKEPNDRWPAGEEMFVSATLAMIDHQNALLENVYEKWCQIAEGAFSTGQYDAEAEWLAHCQLTGATTMRNSYLVLNNRYALTILSCTGDRLRKQTENNLLNWVWQHPRGIGYLSVPLHIPVTEHHPRALRGWFTAHWILSRFCTWREKIKADIDRLWSMQMQDGFWDLGTGANSHNFHLSESWRKQKDRLIDQSVHAMLLMERYYTKGT